MEKFKTPTPEEIAKIQDERTKSDAELIQGGARHKADENGNVGLELTKDQIVKIKSENQQESFPDLASYIKSYKEIAIPAEKVPEEIRNQKGLCYLNNGDSKIVFVDKEGNLAEVNLARKDSRDYRKMINTLKNASNATDIENELTKSGFSVTSGNQKGGELVMLISNYKEQIEKDKLAQKKENFDL